MRKNSKFKYEYDESSGFPTLSPYITYNGDYLNRQHFKSKPNSRPSRSHTSTESSSVFRGLQGFWMRYFTCFNPAHSEAKSSKRGVARSNSVHSSPADSNGGMSAECRDEFINSVIVYCKNNSRRSVVQG